MSRWKSRPRRGPPRTASGLVGTLVLAGIAISTGSDVALVLGAITDLAGHFFVFFSILRAGLHAPIRPLPLRRAPAAAGA